MGRILPLAFWGAVAWGAFRLGLALYHLEEEWVMGLACPGQAGGKDL